LYDNGTCAHPDEEKNRTGAGSGGGRWDEDDEDTEDDARAGGKSMGGGGGSSKSDAKGAGGDAKSSEGVSLYRKELAVIFFNTKSRPSPAGVRGTEVCIPAIGYAGRGGGGGGAEDKDSSGSTMVVGQKNLSGHFARVRSAGKQNVMMKNKLVVLHERTSKYDPLSSCLVDFKGRANVASIKNCQFVESDPQHGTQGVASRPGLLVSFLRVCVCVCVCV